MTDIDTGHVELGPCEYDVNAIVSFASADDFAEGTILARDTSTNKWVLFVPAGNTNGNGIPKGVLAKRLTKVASGAGDLIGSVITFGEVNQDRLVIDGGGSITKVIVDALRLYGIRPRPVNQLGVYDNS